MRRWPPENSAATAVKTNPSDLAKFQNALDQDRLELAFNKMRDVQDPRITYELDRQVSTLQAQMTLRQARLTLTAAQTALDKARAGGDKLELA